MQVGVGGVRGEREGAEERSDDVRIGCWLLSFVSTGATGEALLTRLNFELRYHVLTSSLRSSSSSLRFVQVGGDVVDLHPRGAELAREVPEVFMGQPSSVPD